MEELVLDNGMRFLLVPRPEATTVAAAWAVGVGSAADGPGQSGLSHLLEHLMFQGTRKVGARDADRELAVLAELDEVDAAIRRARSGGRRAELGRLAERRRKLAERAQALADSGELLRLYAEAGARQVDAVTYRDLTVYFAHLPASRLELWFWLESDRLLEPVFRDLGAERAVILAERRRRLEADPTGRGQDELMGRFFAGHPYGQPAQGRPEDLEGISRTEVRDFFRRYYRPSNLVAALVGPVDRDQVRELASRYFGRLEGGPVEEPVVPQVPRARGEEVRIEASCAGRPQLHLLYHTVPFGDPAGYALEVLAGLLNGRTGRLYREMVRERELAFSAYTLQHPLRQAGYFSAWIEGRAGVPPEQLLEEWEGVVARLGLRPPEPAELERVRHQVTAESFRRLRDPLALARQLLVYEALGGWRHLVEGRERLEAVDSRAVVDVARRFLVPSRRAVALYRGEGPGPSTGEAEAR